MQANKSERISLITSYDGRDTAIPKFHQPEPVYSVKELTPDFSARRGVVYGGDNLLFVNYFAGKQGNLTWDKIDRMRLLATWLHRTAFLISPILEDSPLIIKLKGQNKDIENRVLSPSLPSLSPKDLDRIAIAVSRTVPRYATESCEYFYNILTGIDQHLHCSR